MLDSLKCFVVEKRDFMSTSTHILQSSYSYIQFRDMW